LFINSDLNNLLNSLDSEDKFYLNTLTSNLKKKYAIYLSENILLKNVSYLFIYFIYLYKFTNIY
jgi:hypothetical protein